MISQELINKFFKNECSASEKEQIIQIIEKHPELIEQYLSENEWEQFKPTTNLNNTVSTKILGSINKTINRRKTVIRRIGFSVAAASVLLIIGLGSKLFDTNTDKTNLIATAEKHTNTVPFELAKTVNNTDQIEQLVMEDNTVIELAPNSSIKYYKPFVKDNKRTIYLAGEALFKVSKDKTKPFTVFSGDISTTALGTSFTIKAFEKDNYIKVHLHTGKVVVKAADSLNKKWEKDMYLLPDNILMYDKNKMLATLSTTANKNSFATAKGKADNNFRTPNWFMFSNQSLSQVFDQLEEIYGVSINYSNKDLRSMYFIGKFDKTDSVENIIKTIALLNNLTVNKKHGTYTISK